MTELERKAKEFAIHWHCEVNKQMYGNEPYSKHLEDVVELVSGYLKADRNRPPYSTVITCDDEPTMLAAAWLHDVVEDCEQVSIDDIKKEFGADVASVVSALTAPKGTRKEKVAQGYYRNLSTRPFPLYIKLCDRLANVHSAIASGDDRLLKMYAREQKELDRTYIGPCYVTVSVVGKDLSELIRPYVYKWAK